MRVQHNIMAMNAYRNYSSNTSKLSKNLEKLSSGYKINRAGDDAAGLAISEKMRAQITGLQTAQSNAKSGINLVQTAEGSLTEVHDMLNRMVKLADQSANGTYDNDTDRANLQKEVTALKSEIDRIADSSNYNGINLLDGSLGSGDVKLDATSTVKVGAALEKTMITDVKGSLKEGTYTLATGTMTSGTFTAGADGTTVKVSFAKADGSTTVNYVDLSKFAAATGDGAAATAKGAANSIDLGDFSLDMVNTDTATGAGIVAALDGKTVVGSSSGASTGGKGLTLQIGDTSDSYNKLTVSVNDMHTTALGINDVDISTQDGAATAVEKIKSAINSVSSTRGDLGATQNRLEHTINNLSVMTENVQDAESTIRDTDVAEEMMAYTKNNILVQSAQAMLAQANQVPQGVLQLLQ